MEKAIQTVVAYMNEKWWRTFYKRDEW